jgi:hypothetical protein
MWVMPEWMDVSLEDDAPHAPEPSERSLEDEPAAE